jgi:hypothetical protein
MQARYLGATPPAGLQILASAKRNLPPASTDGNGLPPSTISPYSGIYGSDGKLPAIPGPGTTFIAHA